MAAAARTVFRDGKGGVEPDIGNLLSQIVALDAQTLPETLVQPYFGFVRDFDHDSKSLRRDLLRPAASASHDQKIRVAVAA